MPKIQHSPPPKTPAQQTSNSPVGSKKEKNDGSTRTRNSGVDLKKLSNSTADFSVNKRRGALLTAMQPYEPDFRTEFESRDDFMKYSFEIRSKFPEMVNPETGEVVPDIDPYPLDGKISRTVGPHPETLLNPDQPFDVLPFRKKGKPLALRSEKINVPLLTSSVSNFHESRAQHPGS